MDSPLAGRRVLVVEDELIVAWVLQDMLADLGCAVVGPAARVSQALALIEAEAEAVDAAVLDVNLNGEMSYPIADVLTARGVPFVFSTGYDRARLLEGYRSFAMLQKPFHASDLRNALMGLFPPAAPGAPPPSAPDARDAAPGEPA